MSLQKDIADMMLTCTSADQVVMRITFRCGFDVKKTPFPQGIALGVMDEICSILRDQNNYTKRISPRSIENMLSALYSVLTKTKMFDMLSNENRVKVLLDVAKSVYNAGQKDAGLQIVCLIIRKFGIEHKDIVLAASKMPRDSTLDWLVKNELSEHMIDEAHGRIIR